jgi:hypothetical protein
MLTIKLAPTNTPLSRLRDRVFKNSDLMHWAFSACEIQEILRFSSINRAMHEIVLSYMMRAFNIDRILSRFFPDPNAFRVLQRQTATLISGSQALQFLDRTFYPESDLDLYLFPGREWDVGRYLLQIGYTFAPHKHQLPTFQATDKRGYKPDPRPTAYPKLKWREELQLVCNDESEVDSDDSEECVRRHYPSKEEKDKERSTEFRQIRHVYNFLKPDPKNPSRKLKVQLLVASRSPIEAILLNFHSSKPFLIYTSLPKKCHKLSAAVLNVISFEKAYSLYP